MPHNTFRALPLVSLYELLASSTRDMLEAFDSGQDHMTAFKALRKQVESLLTIIEEKRKAQKN